MVCWSFWIQKWLDIIVLDFQIELRCRYFCFFWLCNYFGFFSKQWANLFSNHLVTLLWANLNPENTIGGSITVPLTSCLTALESAVWQLTVYFARQSNPNQSNRRSMVQWFFPFSIPCLIRLTFSQQQQLVITVMIRKHHLKGRDNQNIRSFAGATTFSITTFSITTLSIKGFLGHLSINDTQPKWHSAYAYMTLSINAI